MTFEDRNSFCFTVIDETDAPFCGAVFAMERRTRRGGCEDEGCPECDERYIATSNQCGKVIFCDLPVGEYSLTEISVPEWAERNDEKPFHVRVGRCEVIVDESSEPFVLAYKTKFISALGEDPEHAIGVYNGFEWLEFIRVTAGALLIMIPFAGGTASALFNYLTTTGRTDPTRELILQEISKIVKRNLDDQDIREIRGKLNGINEYMMADFIPSKASGQRPRAELYRDLKVRYDQMYPFIGWLKEINNETDGAYFNVFQLAAIQFISIAQELALLDPSVSNPLNSDYCTVIRREATAFRRHGEESTYRINSKRDSYFKFKTYETFWTMCYKYWIDDYIKDESITYVRWNTTSRAAGCTKVCARRSYYDVAQWVRGCEVYDTLAKTDSAAQTGMGERQMLRHQEIAYELGMEPFYSAMDRLVVTPLDYRP